MKEFHQTWGDFYNKEYKKSDLLWFAWPYPKYFNYILNSKTKTILEVGVGSGMHTILLSLLGFEITGIDNDQKILETAKENNEKFGGKAKFLKMDAFDLKFPPKSFDLVISDGLLEHYNDKEIGELLKEQLRVGKKIVISLPSIGYPNQDYGNERLLTKENWLSIIRKIGRIEILKSKYDGFRSNNIIHSIFIQKNFKFIFSPWRWRYKPRILIMIKEK